MTTAEKLRAEGEARGWANALMEVLTSKFGHVPRSVSDRVRAANADQLRGWISQASTASTLDEAFS